MARSGVRNWQDNWKGSDKESEVKTPASYYSVNANGTYSVAGNLQKGVKITYIDSMTKEHTKAAFKFLNNNTIYYANIDKFVKPGRVGGIDFSPEGFGLDNRTYTSVDNYYNEVIKSIGDRWETGGYSGELYDYLFEVMEHARIGTNNFSGIKMDGFPWGSIQSYFGEVAGPVAAIRRGILNTIIPGVSGARIYMPPSSVALYDYKLLVGNHEYLISAKAGKGVSNQVKPQLVLDSVDSKLTASEKGTKAYNLLSILKSESVIRGAFSAAQLFENTLTPAALNDAQINYNAAAKSSTKLDQQSISIWQPFITKRSMGTPSNVTYGQLRYQCEKIIQEQSKQGTLNTDLKKIFQKYLEESRVIYVKMSISTTTGYPTFTSSNGGVELVRNLYLRTSNDQNRSADKMGFQVS
jgi:hypothetical protein